jgi:hypothetical protein
MVVGGVGVKFQSFYEKRMTRADTGVTERKQMLETEEMVSFRKYNRGKQGLAMQNPVRLLRTQK